MVLLNCCFADIGAAATVACSREVVTTELIVDDAAEEEESKCGQKFTNGGTIMQTLRKPELCVCQVCVCEYVWMTVCDRD